MPIQIDVFDFKCFNQLRNGKDFNLNLSEFTPNLVGNIGETVKVEYKANIQQSANTEGAEEWFIINDPSFKQIERSSGSFLEDGIQVGDVFLFFANWENRRSTADEYNGTVEFISSDGKQLQYSVNAGTDSTGGTVTNVGLSFFMPTGTNANGALFVKFGLLSNDETFNFVSKTTESQQVYYAGGLVSDNIPRDAESLGSIKDWVSGELTVEFTSENPDFRGAQYRVTHTFVLNPFYILSYREFIENGTIPDILAGDSSLKYAAELEFRKTLSNTGSSKIQQFDSLGGFVGWYGENFNGLNADYRIMSVEYEEAVTGDPLDAININTSTKAIVTVENVNGAITDYSCAAYIFRVPDSEDDYIGTATGLLENFLFKSDIVSSPDTSSTDIVTSLVGGNLVIEYTVDYTVAEKLQLTTDDEFILLVQVEDPTISAGNSDRMMLLADFKNYVDIDFIAQFINVPQYNILQFPQQLGDAATQQQILSNEDALLLDARIRLDTTREVVINAMSLELLAYNVSENKSFPLDTYVFNLGELNISNGVQQIAIDTTRGYRLPPGDGFNLVRVVTGSQVGDFREYTIQIGQKIKWQDWIFNPAVDNVFFDALQPNNNLNEKSSNYSGEQNYEIKLALVVNVTGVDDLGRTVTGDFINYGLNLKVNDYDESEDGVTGIIQTFDLETGNSLEGNILYNGKDTLFKAIFQNAAAMQYAIHRIEPSQNQGDGILELSSIKPFPANDLLKPLDGETQLTFDIVGSELTTQCLIDGSLIQEGIAYKLSARAAREPFILTNPFSFTIDTNNAGTTSSTEFQLPLEIDGTYDFLLDKGNGDDLIAITTWDDPATLLDYSGTGAGTYEVKLYGLIRGFSFINGGDRLKVLDITNWGSVDFTPTSTGAFHGCANMTISAPDAPTLGVSLQNFFRGCSSLTSEDFTGWDVSSSESFTGVFEGCTNFNGDVSNWDVRQGTVFQLMFGNCSSFNGNIGSWAFDNGTNFIQMFRGATVFNQPLITWTFGQTNLLFTEMFRNCRDFDQNVNWNVTLGAVNQCFQNAESFDQDLTNWNVSNCNSFNSTFREADAFNSNITNWDVSNASDFTLMFFRAFAFNQNISGWVFNNVGNISFANMFDDATSFNQNISGWNTGRVNNMQNMFDGASLFNQNLGGWIVTNLANANNMFQGTALSTSNLDALYNGWEAQAVQNNVTFGAPNTNYTIAVSGAARGRLISDHFWTINDAGGV